MINKIFFGHLNDIILFAGFFVKCYRRVHYNMKLNLSVYRQPDLEPDLQLVLIKDIDTG